MDDKLSKKFFLYIFNIELSSFMSRYYTESVDYPSAEDSW